MSVDAPPRLLGCLDLPALPGDRVWALPDGIEDDQLFQPTLDTLAEYGYSVKAGYFVWNRELERYRTGRSPRRNEVPLFWAHNARPNLHCKPLDGDVTNGCYGFVRIERTSSAIVRTDAILMQRTSNRKQNRRLIAALILQTEIPGKQGFVSENHTILVLPAPEKKQAVPLAVLCRLLNTSAVDSRFRRMSGTVSVSTKALRILPLPIAAHVNEAFSSCGSDEEAAELAYSLSCTQVNVSLKTKKRAG